MKTYKTKILINVVNALGGATIITFYHFLFFGPATLIYNSTNIVSVLVVDALLALLFFFQHSILIRKSIRARINKTIPDDYYGAFFTITSCFALILMVLFWQKTVPIAEAEGVVYWIMRVPFILALIGIAWSVATMGFKSFDPFGTLKLSLKIRNKEPILLPLAAKGPYQWIRHPLYFFSLVMIWFSPVLSADKILFNCMMTIWIVLGTKLEERDLVRQFGDGYRDYQMQVPMLIPYKIPSGERTYR
jgi:protein-S-isoprenylcysteine O-methyltransferase Ste14